MDVSARPGLACCWLVEVDLSAGEYTDTLSDRRVRALGYESRRRLYEVGVFVLVLVLSLGIRPSLCPVRVGTVGKRKLLNVQSS